MEIAFFEAGATEKIDSDSCEPSNHVALRSTVSGKAHSQAVAQSYTCPRPAQAKVSMKINDPTKKLVEAAMAKQLREVMTWKQTSADGAAVFQQTLVPDPLCQEAAALIEKLGQGWIPVSKILPPVGEVVAVLLSDKRPWAGWHKGGNEWSINDSTVDVTHWMPLPPPPERP